MHATYSRIPMADGARGCTVTNVCEHQIKRRRRWINVGSRHFGVILYNHIGVYILRSFCNGFFFSV